MKTIKDSSLKKIKTALIVTLVPVVLCGCTTFDNFKEEFIDKNSQKADTVKIGVFEPVTGEYREEGALEIKGIELAHSLFPEVLGKDIELVTADNSSDINVAEDATLNLIDKDVDVVLGSYGSVFSMIGGKYLGEAKIPAIAITNKNPLVTENSPYYFRVCVVESYQGKAMAQYAADVLAAKTVAVMAPANDEQAVSVSESFSSEMIDILKNEEALVSLQEYEVGSLDFSGQLRNIKKSGAKVVFLPGQIEDSLNIIRQANKMKLNVTFLGTDVWRTDEFVKQAAKEKMNNIAFSAFFPADANVTEMTEIFTEEYKKKYGADEEPDVAAALGFDAYMLAVKAIESTGSNFTGESLRKSLLATKGFAGASGTIAFDQNGDPEKPIVINTIKKGKITAVYTFDPATAKEEKKAKEKKDKNSKEDKDKEEESKENNKEEN